MPTSEEQKAYRRRHPEYTERERLRNKARVAALEQLKRNHPEEFEQLFTEACKGVGYQRKRF
jgi:hypothetical protein